MKYQLAVFDMDGTILDTIEDLCDTMNHCLEKYNMPQRTLKEVKSFVGNGIHKLVERAVPPQTPDTVIDEIFTYFLFYYKDHCNIKTKPYDGICDTIMALKKAGVHTAVVSNKAEQAVKSLCEDYFPGLFEYAVGDRPGSRIKPYPDGVYAVLDYFHLKKEDCVYIGDSDVDYQTAVNAGVCDLIVGWGFRDEEFLKSIGVKRVIHTPQEILPVFLGDK